MRLLFAIFLFSILIMPTHASESIGKISESAGKVQIKTIKAKRLKGVAGTQINVGDLVKVRKKYNAHDENNKFKAGDKVSIIESKPFSKNKKFEVMDGAK